MRISIDATDQPHITDFGLAKNLGSDTQLTLTGQTLGSPNYIPPEQIRSGRREEVEGWKSETRNPKPEIGPGLANSEPATGKISFATDVYALGAILYHALAGRPPFIGDDVVAVLHQVLQEEPLPPRRLNPSIPADLETICLKCLAKEPGKRFLTAQELADDLGRFLEDKPILARPVTHSERIWRWCRRNPVVASFASATLFLLLVVAIGGPIAAFRINRERRQAELRAYTADINVVQQAWEEGNLARAQALLRAHIPRKGQPDLRGFEWRYLWTLCHDESHLSFTNFPSGVRMVLSPNGGLAAAGSGQIVRLLDCVNGREAGTLPVANATGEITALAFSPADTNALVIAFGREVHLCNLVDRRATATLTLSNPAVAVAISNDGKLLAAVTGNEQTIELWRLADRKMMWARPTATPVHAVAFPPDGKRLVSGGGEACSPVFWDLLTGTPETWPIENRGWINCIVFSADSRFIATALTGSTIVVWDGTKRKVIDRLILPTEASALAFSADGHSLFTGTEDSTIRRWDVATHQQTAIYRGHQSRVSDIALTPDGRSIVSSSFDGMVKVWDLQSEARNANVLSSESSVRNTNFSPDSKRIGSVDWRQRTLTLWDVSTKNRIADFKESSTNEIGHAFFSPNGQVVACSLGYHIKILDGKTLALRAELTNGFDPITFSFSPDSRTLAASGLPLRLHGITNRLAFWDLQSMQPIHRLAAAAPLAVIVSFSHDGRKVAVGYLNGEVRVWDYQAERLVSEFTDQHDRIWSVAFSPDDSWLAAGGNEGVVVFYDLRAQRAFRPAAQPLRWILGLCFSPDGKTLASTEGDGTVKLWNVASRDIALTLRGHVGWIGMDPCFSPDGNLLATAGSDGTLLLWPAAPTAEINKLRRGPE